MQLPSTRKFRKQTKVERLEAEVNRLQKLLQTMIHLHERLKNERTQTVQTPQLPTLHTEASVDSETTEKTHIDVPRKTDSEPTN